MDFICNNCDAICAALLSGILSAIGQALRIGIGLYKLQLVKNPLLAVSDRSNPSKKLGVIFIGFLVGVAIALLTNTNSAALSTERIILLIASGYAVTHLLESTSAMIALKKITSPEKTKNKAVDQPLSALSIPNQGLECYANLSKSTT